ncbi:uncharacterized protein LOC142893426 isoform X2 [Nelusetta ayraudi]|uniref:uncharacterized protein LOC142893426 isoform X2 n=1 Tax=Nelusetta ayraudi TaxID=303726 RepID=UPI003F72D668
MMTSPLSAFCLTLLLVGGMAHMSKQFSASHHQDETFISATEGENLTLKCSVDPDSTRIQWYKQSLGKESRLMYTWYRVNNKGAFYEEFNNNPRFSMDTGTDKHHLKISNLSLSDSAFYFCAGWDYVTIELDHIIFVTVRSSASNIPPLILQSASKTNQPKDSLTLNCTVHTGSCGEEHSVYWFRDSGGSHPGLIYTQGGSNDQCEGRSNTQTHTCVYNLPVESLNLPHDGTYYCAVAACGHILFGGGTKLDIEKFEDSLLVYYLSAALVLTLITVACLIFSWYKMKRNFDSVESQAGCSASSAENTMSHHGADDIHYAALHLNQPSRSRKQRTNPDNECVYSGVNL